MREKLRAQPSSDGRSPLPNNIERDVIYRNLEKEIGIDMGSTEKFQKELGFPVLSPICKLIINQRFERSLNTFFSIAPDADPKIKLQNGTRGEGGKPTSGQGRGRGRGNGSS